MWVVKGSSPKARGSPLCSLTARAYNSFTINERTHTRQAAYNIRYHFVFCPKLRRPVLAGAAGQRLEEMIPGLIHSLGVRFPEACFACLKPLLSLV